MRNTNTVVRSFLRFAALSACTSAGLCCHTHSEATSPATYYVDCSDSHLQGITDGGHGTHLRSLEEVNGLVLNTKDTVLFRRGSVCKGALQPKGNGFSLGAFGEGPLPRIEAGASDEAALTLNNQESITVSSLEFVGGTTYGVHLTGNKGEMRSITLRSLTIRDVKGPLKKKDSGLLVIGPSSPEATFTDLTIDSVRAYNTTQWSGIFVAGGSLQRPASRVMVQNSVVHDVQGDGIVLFNARDGAVRHSLAWHTGMQHQQSIGTPNGIWTWQCVRCKVSENEAFLTDSPGVDGGAFDIDWGNSQNTVQGNYGHDTQGYCVSVFAANGPTSQSVIDGNTCINNGLSPRLAQRQGALLLMSWNGGTIEGLQVSNNFIDWRPPGNSPAIQAGSALRAKDVTVRGNRVLTDVTPVIDPALSSIVSSAGVDAVSLKDADISRRSGAREKVTGEQRGSRWQLIATVPAPSGLAASSEFGALLINLTSAAAQYRPETLKITLRSTPSVEQAASDWGLARRGIFFAPDSSPANAFRIDLVSPSGRVVRSWTGVLRLAEVGMELRRTVGPPDFSRLSFVNVQATD